LAPATNRLFSSKMGYDFSNVKIHTDKAAAESAKGINAKAYATGNNIVFSEGQFDMESQQGKRLMAHELTHIIQQNPDVQREPVDAGVPIAGVPDKSAIAKELEEVWYTKGKDAFIDRVKKLRPEERGDMDTHVFILNNLPGDERWYAETLLFWGPEYGWSFEQKIELELKSLPQSKGYAGVSSLLKGASTSEKKTILKSFLTRMKILFSKQDFAKLMVDIDIPALISGAGNSEKLWILNDEPLMILLKQEFSQGQFNKLVKDLINLSHLPAGVLQDTVADLLYSPEEIDRNTAKGLINQRLTVYYFESLTHASDEADVLKKNGYDAAKYSVYNSPPGSKGPLIVPHNAMGFWIQGTSVIVGYQSRSLADWKIILVHETNHALNPVSGLDPVKNYITEFRAYWVSTYRGVANPDDRASQIKAHILKEYPLISEPYNKKADVKKAIDAYTRPDGNLLNK
jgi:hypothetical protein